MKVLLATFDVDVTPPFGSAMAYDAVKRLDELTLRCRGVVLLGAEQVLTGAMKTLLTQP